MPSLSNSRSKASTYKKRKLQSRCKTPFDKTVGASCPIELDCWLLTRGVDVRLIVTPLLRLDPQATTRLNRIPTGSH